MSQDTIIKIADEISDQLILLCQKGKVEEKTILELYDELLEPQYKKYHNDILSYISERLAVKGYEIVNSNYFELKKY